MMPQQSLDGGHVAADHRVGSSFELRRSRGGGCVGQGAAGGGRYAPERVEVQKVESRPKLHRGTAFLVGVLVCGWWVDTSDNQPLSLSIHP